MWLTLSKMFGLLCIKLSFSNWSFRIVKLKELWEIITNALLDKWGNRGTEGGRIFENSKASVPFLNSCDTMCKRDNFLKILKYFSLWALCRCKQGFLITPYRISHYSNSEVIFISLHASRALMKPEIVWETFPVLKMQPLTLIFFIDNATVATCSRIREERGEAWVVHSLHSW